MSTTQFDPASVVVIGQGHVAYGQGFKQVKSPAERQPIAEEG